MNRIAAEAAPSDRWHDHNSEKRSDDCFIGMVIAMVIGTAKYSTREISSEIARDTAAGTV